MAHVRIGSRAHHAVRLCLYDGAGDVTVLKGANDPAALGGVGVTEAVELATWNAWLERNKDSALVRDGLIFVLDDEAPAPVPVAEAGDAPSASEPDATDAGDQPKE